MMSSHFILDLYRVLKGYVLGSERINGFGVQHSGDKLSGKPLIGVG